MQSKKILMVAGAPRSGTTAMGKMLCFSKQVNYLLEPFNPINWSNIPDSYPYIGTSTPDRKKEEYRKIIDDVTAIRKLLPTGADAPGTDLKSKTLNFLRQSHLGGMQMHYRAAQFRDLLSHNSHILLKSPRGIFLSEFLINEYGGKVVFTVRHPAAIYLSRKQLGWNLNLDVFTQQKDLCEDIVLPLKIDCSTDLSHDVLGQSICQWNILYSYINALKERYPDDVCIVRHEDFCNAPVEVLKNIYKFCGIQWKSQYAVRVLSATGGGAVLQQGRLKNLEARDSKRLSISWKGRLTELELARINNELGTLLDLFYLEDIYRTL